MIDDSFVKKYKIEGLGRSIKTPRKTLELVVSLCRNNEEINKMGKDYARSENRLFGGCPQPGEPGSEEFFKSR